MKIGIIGLGLIGGSLLKRLSALGYELYAVTRNQSTLDKIKYLTTACSNDYSVLKDCHVVFVCTPIGNVSDTLAKLENVVSQDCIVADVASVKEFVTHKKYRFKFIPSHPMAGTENNGYDSSFAELFEGAKWVLTPYDCKETEILSDIIKQTGAVPVIASPDEHDRAVAMISHLPMYIAQSLFAAAKDNKLAMLLASSGFRDTTRLAGTNLTLAKDMLKYNGKNIGLAEEKFKKILEELKNNYTEDVLKPIQKSRRKMYSPDGKNLL